LSARSDRASLRLILLSALSALALPAATALLTALLSGLLLLLTRLLLLLTGLLLTALLTALLPTLMLLPTLIWIGHGGFSLLRADPASRKQSGFCFVPNPT
jgi:hypothetical protein